MAKIMTKRMILNETSYFGKGSVKHIVSESIRRGFKKALIVTDKVLLKHGVVNKVTELLDGSGIPYDIYDGVVPNPTISIVHEGIERFKLSGADFLIAIGGGSPQDTCKAIGIIVKNPDYHDVRRLEGFATTKNPAVPIFAVPTTAGTAAEVTTGYVITDIEKRRKFLCMDPHCIPLVSFIDADMMSSMPASLKAATGFDALTHAIEGYITREAWELSDALHLKAIEIIGRSLRGAVAGSPKEVENMALAQYVAGMGFSNVGLGLVHGMAHPLGAFYDMPHGVANAVLLPYVMAYNAEHTGDKYRDIAFALGIESALSMGLTEVRLAAVEAVRQLSRDVNIPGNLRSLGMKKEDVPALSQAAMIDACTRANPRKATEHDISEIFLQAL